MFLENLISAYIPALSRIGLQDGGFHLLFNATYPCTFNLIDSLWSFAKHILKFWMKTSSKKDSEK
jgi:hypothetical protein